MWTLHLLRSDSKLNKIRFLIKTVCESTYCSSKRIYYLSSSVCAKMNAAGLISESGITGAASSSAFSLSYYERALSFLS